MEEYIPDMSAQEVVKMTLTDSSLDRHSLEQIFTKNCQDIVESLLRTHIPKVLDNNLGTSPRHPYLPPALRIEKTNLFSKNSKSSNKNVLDTLAVIAENQSIGDLYTQQGAWKK